MWKTRYKLLISLIVLVISLLALKYYSVSTQKTKPVYESYKKQPQYTVKSLSSNNEPESPEPTTLTWNDNKIFGDVASQFNYFANEIDASNNQAIHGNYATQNLLSDPDAVRGDGIGNSYIQKTLTVKGANSQSGTSFKFGGTGNLILGKDMTFSAFSDKSELTSGNNQYKVTTNSDPVVPLSIGKVKQDKGSNKYVDFDQVFTKLKSNSQNLAEKSKEVNIKHDNSDWYEYTIQTKDITNDNGTKYIKVNQADMPVDWQNLNINEQNLKTLVITIDISNSGSVINDGFIFGDTLKNTNILINYYNDSGKKINVYTGEQSGNTAKRAILAPNATVELPTGGNAQTFRGNIVAQTFINNSQPNQDSLFPDIVLPNNNEQPTQNQMQLTEAPNITFSPKSGSNNTFTGSMLDKETQHLTVVNGTEGKPIKISVKLAEQGQFKLASQPELADNAVTLSLLEYKYNNKVAEVQNNMAVNKTDAASINWGYSSGIDLINDFNYNYANKNNGDEYYEFQLTRNQSVLPGDYTAKLLWTLNDVP